MNNASGTKLLTRQMLRGTEMSVPTSKRYSMPSSYEHHMNFSMKVIWSSLAPICSARGGLVRVDCTRSRESDPVLPQVMFTRPYWMCCVPYISHPRTLCKHFLNLEASISFFQPYGSKDYASETFQDVSSPSSCGSRRNLTDYDRDRVELLSFCSTLWGCRAIVSVRA